jgi:DNA-binding MarR family transcriptional regulator
MARAVVLVRRMSGRFDGAIAAVGGSELAANTDVLVLLRLAHGGPARPSELQHATGLSSGGTTKLLDRLEELGVVARRRDVAGDRRGVSVALTASGRRRTARILAALGDALDEARPLAKEVLELLADLEAPPAVSTRSRRAISAEEAIDALGTLGTRLEAAMAPALADADLLRPRAFSVLCLVADEGAVRPAQVIDYAGMSSGGVTKLIDQLEQRGLAERAHGADDDRRAIVVRLTAAGAGLVERVADDLGAEVGTLARAMALVTGVRAG